MSRASTVTKLSLYEWAKIMGILPLHFCGVQISATQAGTVGSSAWFQHEWQDNDRVSREEVARAIRSAEDDIENYVGYRLMPAFEYDEWKPTTRPYHPETANLNDRDIRGRGQQVSLKWGHMISGGIQSKEVIEEDATIVWSTTKGPTTYEDTGTIIVSTTVTDSQEIRLYVPEKAADDAAEIRPITVVIDAVANLATITFPRELAVLESIYESMEVDDPASNLLAQGINDAHFYVELDVYRVYLDPQQQATVLWEPSTRVTDEEAAAYGSQTAALWLRGDPIDPAVIYAPATWDAATNEFSYSAYLIGRQPDLVRLWYYAGLQDKSEATPRLTMDRNMALAVAHMAAARLGRDDCGGHNISEWRKNLAISEFQGDRVALPPQIMSNPFGTRAGEVSAFQKFRMLAKGESTLA